MPAVACYVANAASNEIYVFALDTHAVSLNLIQTLAFPAGVGALAFVPDTACLYAVLRSPRSSIASLATDRQTGRLELRATTEVAHQFVYVSTDRTGRFMLGASYTDAVFGIYEIEQSGIVAARPAQLTSTPPHAHCILTDPTNRFIFVTSLGGDRILSFRFDAAAGRATPAAGRGIDTPAGSGPRHLVFHPHRPVVYVNGELDGSIGAYAADFTSGELVPRTQVDTRPPGSTAAPWAGDLHVSPDGRFLYTSDRRTDTLTHFAVGADSTGLERRSITGCEAQPRSFAIDPSGRVLVVAGERSNHIGIYAIDPLGGELTLRNRYPVGEKPAWVTVVALER